LRGFQSLVSQNPLQSISIPSNPYGLKITEQALSFTSQLCARHAEAKQITMYKLIIVILSYETFPCTGFTHLRHEVHFCFLVFGHEFRLTLGGGGGGLVRKIELSCALRRARRGHHHIEVASHACWVIIAWHIMSRYHKLCPQKNAPTKVNQTYRRVLLCCATLTHRFIRAKV
jgi:hypothetical protein